MKKIKIGILSTANIGMRSIVPNILQLTNEFELVAVATRTLKNESEKQYPKVNLIEGYDNLFKEDINAVYIPLPNAMHYEWVKYAIQRKVHVLVEKSLACSFDEVKELNDLARANNVVLIENFQFRFHSQLDFVKSFIESGRLGDIRILRSTFCCPPFPDKTNIRYDKNLGGGALFDTGAYPIKISQILLGKDLEVSSATLNKSQEFEVDIWGGGCLKQLSTGCFSQFAFGFDNHYQNNLEIVGSKGKLYAHRIFTAREDYQPKIVIETQEDGLEELILETDNHFKNMLLYFHSLISNPEKREKEYADNINQARLISNFIEKAHE